MSLHDARPISCGDDKAASPNGESADRTVEVDMVDIAFEPETIDVAAGETVRFVFTNSGEVAHDAFIGDDTAQDDHAADKIGRAHVCTPVTHAHLVCRLLLEKNNYNMQS